MATQTDGVEQIFDRVQQEARRTKQAELECAAKTGRLHKAAPQMLLALKYLRKHYDHVWPETTAQFMLYEAIEAAEGAQS